MPDTLLFFNCFSLLIFDLKNLMLINKKSIKMVLIVLGYCDYNSEGEISTGYDLTPLQRVFTGSWRNGLLIVQMPQELLPKKDSKLTSSRPFSYFVKLAPAVLLFTTYLCVLPLTLLLLIQKLEHTYLQAHISWSSSEITLCHFVLSSFNILETMYLPS